MYYTVYSDTLHVWEQLQSNGDLRCPILSLLKYLINLPIL